MNGASVLLTIIKRESEQDFMEFMNHHQISTLFSFPGEGTASRSILSLLGLEDTEKTVMVSVTSRLKAKRAMQDMVTELGINMPGRGIALSLPVSSIGGAAFMKSLMGEPEEHTYEVNEMEQKRTYPYELIMVIARQGSSELVMNAARGAGAGGGTVVHAKGTAPGAAGKFFGISIADEKELILIATRHERKDKIMHAIMDEAGPRSEAQAVVFTLPVEDVEGLRSVIEDHENP